MDVDVGTLMSSWSGQPVGLLLAARATLRGGTAARSGAHRPQPASSRRLAAMDTCAAKVLPTGWGSDLDAEDNSRDAPARRSWTTTTHFAWIHRVDSGRCRAWPRACPDRATGAGTAAPAATYRSSALRSTMELR